MTYGVFLAMSLLAGGWLLPATRGEWSLSARLALCVALSPFVVALQAVVLSALGVSLTALCWGLVFFNLIPAFFVVRELRGRSPRIGLTQDAVLGLLAGAIPFVWLLVSWGSIDNLRAFGWHNLLHVDIVYQLAQRGLHPEEPELAGLPLAYSWFGHAYWLVTGVASNQPPTRIFPLQNLALLASAMVLIFGAARRLGVRPAFAVLAAVVAVFGNHLGRELAEFSSISHESLWPLVGEKRLSSPLVKFRSLNLMPASFAIHAGLLFLWSGRGAVARYQFAALHGLFLCASALFYPVGFPAALCFSATVVCLQMLWPQPLSEGRGQALALAGWTAAGAGIAALSLGLWVGATQMGATASVASLRPLDEIGQRLVHLTTAVGPFLLLALPGLGWGFRKRDVFAVALGLSSLLMLAVYAVFEVRYVEYKYVLYARLGLGLLIGLGLDRLFSNRAQDSRSRPAFAWVRSPWAVTGALLLVFSALSFNRIGSDSVPPSLLSAPSMDESAFQIRPAKGSSHAGWTRAIREQTPVDTIVIADLPFHVGPFTARSLYYPSETLPRVSAGYAISAQLNLVRMRGYEEAVFDERGRVREAIFGTSSKIPHRVVLRTLENLERPIAIHSLGEASEFLLWCRRLGHGRLLFEDGDHRVWFFETEGGAP